MKQAEKTVYVCYDSFNQTIRSRHKTIAAACAAADRRDRRLVKLGYSAIHTVEAIDDGEIRPFTRLEQDDYDRAAGIEVSYED